MAKLGGLIGAVLAIAIVMYVGDRIAWTARQSDWIGSAVFVAVGIGGWLAGSRLVQRLANGVHLPTRRHNRRLS
jgi:phosphate/sulfate permease